MFCNVFILCCQTSLHTGHVLKQAYNASVYGLHKMFSEIEVKDSIAYSTIIRCSAMRWPRTLQSMWRLSTPSSTVSTSSRRAWHTHMPQLGAADADRRKDDTWILPDHYRRVQARQHRATSAHIVDFSAANLLSWPWTRLAHPHRRAEGDWGQQGISHLGSSLYAVLQHGHISRNHLNDKTLAIQINDVCDFFPTKSYTLDDCSFVFCSVTRWKIAPFLQIHLKRFKVLFCILILVIDNTQQNILYF